MSEDTHDQNVAHLDAVARARAEERAACVRELREMADKAAAAAMDSNSRLRQRQVLLFQAGALRSAADALERGTPEGSVVVVLSEEERRDVEGALAHARLMFCSTEHAERLRALAARFAPKKEAG